MAVLLEMHYEKDQILESYINEVYLGQQGRRSVHGFELAAQHYFDQPLAHLGLHHQALLIGMIKGPSLYNPERNPERALKRRNVVLGVMAEEGADAILSNNRRRLSECMFQGQLLWQDIAVWNPDPWPENHHELVATLEPGDERVLVLAVMVAVIWDGPRLAARNTSAQHRTNRRPAGVVEEVVMW